MSLFSTYRKPNNPLSSVMLDVIIALIPALLVAYYAFGTWTLLVVGTSVVTCLLTEIIFSRLFTTKSSSIWDGSAWITGILLALTLSPLTPWYVVSFGAAAAIIFGKLLWGGVGKNRFNPALIGREFMVAFFPLILNVPSIWNIKTFATENISPYIPFLQDEWSLQWVKIWLYNPSGALGEYSILALIIGAIYLILRRRITWHIPAVFLFTFFVLTWLVPSQIKISYSLGGLLLGGIFMATDMPSSPHHSRGKIFYSISLAIVTILLILNGVRFAYMSLAILILNVFTPSINTVLSPLTWGHRLDFKKNFEDIVKLSISILILSLAVCSLYHIDALHYIVYAYILYCLYNYQFTIQHKLNNPI